MHHHEKDTLFIIDGSYLLYRSFYAIRPLHTSKGVPVQAVFGFCRAIKQLLSSFVPYQLIVVWDSKGPNFRHDIYKEYKATRQTPPADLFTQKELILQFLDTILIKQIAVTGYEADDIIAGLCHKFDKHKIVLVCPDKDMYQLLSSHVHIYDPFKDAMIDEKSFEAESGFNVTKIPFYYALLGDSSDNIPGVDGIGKKGALELVKQFDSLDDLYHNIDRIAKPRTKQLLVDQKESAFLSLKLFTLVPPQLSLSQEETAFEHKNWKLARTFFENLEFKSLVKELDREFGSLQQSLISSDEGKIALVEIKKKNNWNVHIIQTQKDLSDLVALLEKAPSISIDTETTGIFPMLDTIVGISFAIDKHNAYYIPIAHSHGEQLKIDDIIKHINPLLKRENVEIIMHNAKFDHHILAQAGFDFPVATFDTMIAANILRKNWQKINLKDLSALLLNEEMQTYKEVVGTTYKNFAQVPIDQGARYAAHDALQTYKLRPVLEAMLEQEPSLGKLFFTIDMPFYYVLLRMEEKGILLDTDKVKKLAATYEKHLATIETKIFASLGQHDQKINLNSPKQLEYLLFDQLQLPVIKKSPKGARSTDQEVLSALSLHHPIATLLLQHRELTKIKSTYLDPLPGYINSKTGRIHTNYSQTLVATGRLSSQDPNLQNIPTNSEIRSCFYAPIGSTFIAADYSQIELRILAYLTQDSNLVHIFKNGLDIHTQTAAQLFSVPIEKVSNEQRQLGKRINFSIIYGISPFGLAKELGLKQSEAKAYIETYFAQYPGVGSWIEKTVNNAISRGYTETECGRRRYIPELHERNKTLFEAGRRMAANSPIQGTQADILKIAMINIDKTIIKKKLQSRIILQIHDEIVLEVPHGEEEIISSLLHKEMIHVVDWNVPLSVSIRQGKDWGEITK